MSGVIVSLPGWQAATDQLDGFARTFLTLPEPRRVTRLDARLNVPSGTDVTVTVSDSAANLAVLTVPAGEDHASTSVDIAFAAGEVTCTTAGADGDAEGFLGNLWLADVGGAPTAGDTLVDLDDLKEALGSPTTTPSEDEWLQRQLEAYSERIRHYCNRHFNRRRYIQTHDYPEKYVTTEAPIQVIHSCTASGQTIDPSSLRVNHGTGQVSPTAPEAAIRWNEYHPVELDYEAGYDSCPAGVAELIYMGIGNRWEAYKGGDLNPEASGRVKRETIQGAGTIEYDLGMLSSADKNDYTMGFPLSALDPWVRYTALGGPTERTFWVLA